MAGHEAKVAIKGTDKLSPAVVTAARNLAGKLSPALASAKTKATSLGKASSSLGSKLGGMLKSIPLLGGALGGLLGGLSLAGFGALAKDYTNATDALAKYSKTVGLTAEQVQALRYAGERNGISTQVMNASLQKFNLNLAQAKNGTGAFAGFLDKVSPSLKKTLLATDNTNEAFRVMVGALAKIPDPAKRALLASEAFGKKTGSYMALLGNEGVKGLDVLIARFKKYNGVSNQSAEEAEGMADALLDFDMATAGVKNSIMGALIPSLLPLVSATSEWIATNKDAIKSGMVSFLGRLGSIFESLEKSGVLSMLKTLGVTLGRVLMPFISMAIGHFRNLWNVLQGPMQVGFKVVIALLNMAGSVFNRVLSPALSWVSGLFMDLFEYVADSGFGKALSVMADKVVSFAGSFDENLGGVIEDLKKGYADLVDRGADFFMAFETGWGKLKDIVSSVWEAVKSGAKAAYEKMAPILKVMSPLFNLASKSWESSPGTLNPGSPSLPGTGGMIPALSYSGLQNQGNWGIKPISPTVSRGEKGSMAGVVEVRVSTESGSKATVVQASNKTNTNVKLKASTGTRSIWGAQ